MREAHMSYDLKTIVATFVETLLHTTPGVLLHDPLVFTLQPCAGLQPQLLSLLQATSNRASTGRSIRCAQMMTLLHVPARTQQALPAALRTSLLHEM